MPPGGESPGGRLVRTILLAGALLGPSAASAGTPVAGHYPPGQSGLRGGGAPRPGWSVTNFNRFFSNLEAKDANGAPAGGIDELRYANITMITWTTDHRLFGLAWGAMAGIPFSTGNLNPSSDELAGSTFGLGDILVTPIALYHRGTAWDYTIQFTYWSSSGRFTPGSPDNRGAGFESLVYSLGGAWYPGGRDRWSLSAISRFGQNFEQSGSGITPGDDLVIDGGVGKVVGQGIPGAELGLSGFATWQLSEQTGGDPGADTGRYRYFGAGPEGSLTPWDDWTFRLRMHWEFGARNAVQGNNVWFIVNGAF